MLHLARSSRAGRRDFYRCHTGRTHSNQRMDSGSMHYAFRIISIYFNLFRYGFPAVFPSTIFHHDQGCEVGQWPTLRKGAKLQKDHGTLIAGGFSALKGRFTSGDFWIQRTFLELFWNVMGKDGIEIAKVEVWMENSVDGWVMFHFWVFGAWERWTEPWLYHVISIFQTSKPKKMGVKELPRGSQAHSRLRSKRIP